MITKNRPKILEMLPTMFLLSLAVFLSVWQSTANTVQKGINLWVACVVPTLFPYLFITALCSKLSGTRKFGNLLSPITTKLFNTGGISGYLFLISTVSGFPSGSKAVADAKNEGFLGEVESVRASVFCSMASPVFLISSVGKLMFNDLKFGFLLFLSNFFTSVIIGIIFSFYKRKDLPTSSKAITTTTSKNLLFDSTLESVTSLLVVGGLITVFYLLSEIFLALNLLMPLIKLISFITKDEVLSVSIATGVLEVTGGLKRLSLVKNSNFLLPIASALTGFGGVSVIVQSIAFLKLAKIKTAPFFLSKILSAVLNFILSLILSLIFL